MTIGGGCVAMARPGILGYILIALRFQPAPTLLGFGLGPRLEENFRRAVILSRGDLGIFNAEPISAVLLLVCCVMLGLSLWVRCGAAAR